MESVLRAGFLVGAVLGVFLASTVVFDTLHWTLHRWARSRWRILRALGGLHEVHHRFLDTELRVHEELVGANLRHHVVPEYLTQVGVSLLLFLVLPWPVVVGALTLQTGLFSYILSRRGMDLNHRPVARLRAYRPSFLCPPEYHALHHAFPGGYVSAFLKVVDYALRSGVDLASRPVAVTGAESPFGAALAEALRRRGATVTAIAPRDAERGVAPGTVLVLAHGGAAASYARAVESAIAARGDALLPPEVWVLDAGPELARFHRSGRVICKRIGVAPDRAAPGVVPRVLSGLRRGFDFVPVRRGPAAVVDYLRFRTEVRRHGRRVRVPAPARAG